MAEERNFRKVRRGYVVSDKMDKTITVELEQRSTHPLYGKVVRSTRTVKVHDCLLYTSPSPRDLSTSRMPSSA